MKCITPLCPNTLLIESLKYIKSGTVLDLGCGQGNDSVFLAKNKFVVTSVDNWQEALDDAKKLSKIHNTKINFILSDITSFHSLNKFDLIICNNTLHLLSNDDSILLIKKMQDLTNKSGLNLITTFSSSSPPKNFLSLLDSSILKDLYKDWEILHFKDSISPSTIEIIARKN